MRHRARALAASVGVITSCASEAPGGTASATPTASAAPAASAMILDRRGTQPSSKGPATRFIGDVTVTPLFAAHAQRRTFAAYVTFAVGARSAWHSHPAGQTLVVTEGTGWVQQWGKDKKVMRPGDVVWTPPGVKHWHGATDSEAMTHMAIQEDVDGGVVEWMEQVSPGQYAAAIAP